MIQTAEQPKAPAASERGSAPRRLSGVLPIQPEEREVIEPRDRMHMLDWLEESFYLPEKTSHVSGVWRREMTPYWVPVIDWLSDVGTRVIDVFAATQLGKTTLSAGWFAYVMDQDPGPLKMVLPDEATARKRIKLRLRTTFGASPVILEHLGGSVDNLLIGEPSDLPGMVVTLGWPTCPATLADDPCRYILGDEVGEWHQALKDDTDPLTKLNSRVRWFRQVSKQFYMTSPRDVGDLADGHFKLGQSWVLWWQCPHCRGYHVPKWDKETFVMDKRADGHLLEAEAYAKGGRIRYVCPDCRARWNMVDRRQAIRGCVAAPEGCSVDDAGHIVGQYKSAVHKCISIPAWFADPSVTTLDDLAAMWAAAMLDLRQGKIEKFRDFVNNQMAQSWVEKARATDLDQVRRHVSHYERGILPRGVQLITVAVDVQLDHVWIDISGWGYLYQCWVIYADRLETGDTKELGNWEIVREFINATWPTEEDPSLRMRARKVGIDAKFNTNTVQAFCLQCRGEIDAVPVMGDPRMTGRLYTPVKLADDFYRFNLNVNAFKDQAYHQLFAVNDPGPGYCHLHKGFPPDFLHHYISEHQVRERERGKERLVWRPKVAGRPNHLWDCRVYNRFLAEIAGTAALADRDLVADEQARQEQARQRARNRGKQGGFLDDLPKL